MKYLPTSSLLLVLLLGAAACESRSAFQEGPALIRVTTFNVEDVRTDDLLNPDHPRLKVLAARLQELRPDIVLINEIAYDQPGVPGYEAGATPGQNGQRLADTFIAVAQGEGLQPIRYIAFMAPSNTGRSSGYDLDGDGAAVTTFPPSPSAAADGTPAAQTPAGRAYGNDAWGFGTFPGQYAMAVLVREGLTILEDEVRTFQRLPWRALPDALQPADPETGQPWYDEAAWKAFPLSSKTHMDVPVRLPNGTVLHVLASHPTPPAFDGPEQRNKKRNHDEIRFWADYLNDAGYIVDDSGASGGLPASALFVIVGDLNADPDEGAAVNNPIENHLLRHPRINGAFVPAASAPGQTAFPELDPDDTARWGLRVDYVLPSMGMTVRDGGVWRPGASSAPAVSDHFPVWLDLTVPENP